MICLDWLKLEGPPLEKRYPYHSNHLSGDEEHSSLKMRSGCPSCPETGRMANFFKEPTENPLYSPGTGEGWE